MGRLATAVGKCSTVSGPLRHILHNSDLYLDMPVSGPGRQPTIRRNSMKGKKKKKDGALQGYGGPISSSTTSPIASSMMSSDEHRMSVAGGAPISTGDLIDGTTAIENVSFILYND